MILTIFLVATLWIVEITLVILLNKKAPGAFGTQCFLIGIGIVETIILIGLQMSKS